MDRETFKHRMIVGVAVVATTALFTGLVAFTEYGKFLMGLIGLVV